jgi:hypothetical protein
MMKGLFRSFEEHGLEYLLIGGQAAVLYGAAHFTSDVDLWVAPTELNLQHLREALAAIDAKVHKLTPPLELPLVQRGHGFHFVIPTGDGNVYLDVMGVPPRSVAFVQALRRAEKMATLWGELPVCAIEDLVELKKTNRPGDYEVISRLARIRLARNPTPEDALVVWAVGNAFRVEDVLAIVRVFARSLPAILLSFPVLGPQVEDPNLPQVDEDRIARWVDLRLVELLDAGRKYWRPRIDELRNLRADGKLLREGLAVRDI